MRGAPAISVLVEPHFPPWPCQQRIVFRSSFSSSGLETKGTEGQEISGDYEQEFIEKFSLLARLARACLDGVGKMVEAIKGFDFTEVQFHTPALEV